MKEISATRRSSTKRVASSVPKSMKSWKIGGSFSRSMTLLHSPCTASAVSGVLGEGFHTQALPQMTPRQAFQDHTATGKLKAVMMPTTPRGSHCSGHAVAWALGVHGEAVEHARLADREVGDVDHLLHLA